MPSCVLLLGDKLRQSRPEKIFGRRAFGYISPAFWHSCTRVSARRPLLTVKSESLRTAWLALQGAEDHETLPALPGAVLEASR